MNKQYRCPFYNGYTLAAPESVAGNYTAYLDEMKYATNLLLILRQILGRGVILNSYHVSMALLLNLAIVTLWQMNI